MGFYNAKRCFEENLRLFVDPKTQQEKYNLYNGLLNLVIGLELLEQQVQHLAYQIQALKRS